MDPLTLILAAAGLIIGALGSWYTYLSYRRSQEARITDRSSTQHTKTAGTINLNTAETLLFLLLIDQFPVGLWGASLEEDADFYGHKGGDPGSITISTISSEAIAIVTHSTGAEPILRYRSYLLNRQSPDGAFGMKQATGSKWREEQILEHARHTATAANFFLFFDGVEHKCVIDAVRYLLSEKAQTESSLWVDHGAHTDERVDPITVAFVIGLFEDVRMALNENPSAAHVVQPAMLDQSIRLGLDYVFSTKLRTDEGLWLYRYGSPSERARILQNAYQYTTDVLANIGKSCRRLGVYLEKADQVFQDLVRVGQRYGGIPKSSASNVPDIDTSATLVTAASSLGQLDHLQRDLYRNAFSLCSDRIAMEKSAANGWSALLILADAPWASELQLSADAVNRVYEHADAVIPNNASPIPHLTGMPEAKVRELLARRRGVQPN
jgi:hypothetical protein